MRTSEDNDYGEADKEFHLIIALSANNPFVQGLIDSLLITHNKINSLIQVRERERTVEFHKAVHMALEARYPQEAFLQMYKHLNFFRQKVLPYSSADNH